MTDKKVKAAPPGRHGDGRGLYLLVKPNGARFWMLRVQSRGIRRDIGLGSYHDVSLAEARDRATQLRKVAKLGHDPIAERDKDKAGATVPTFKGAAADFHESAKSGWTARVAKGWLASMEKHVFPSLGEKPVDQIDAPAIAAALKPIWLDTPVVARKLRQRVAQVLNFAHSMKWRPDPAPSDAIRLVLKSESQPRARNHPAMPYADVPTYIAKLRGEPETMGRLALMFTIFTAARGGETRGTLWSHFDLEAKLWHRPAELMKERVAHTVTLNQAALDILGRAQDLRTTAADCLVFASRSGRPLSNMTLSKILRDEGLAYTVHGFRSSFRDWAAERMPEAPEAVAEAALAHAVPDATVRAYKRTTFLEMRRGLLAGWAEFCVPSMAGLRK